MKDSLEQFIQENKQAFNQKRMPEGHELRFAEKLELIQPPKKQTIQWVAIFKVAASVAIIIGFGMGMFYLGQNQPNQNMISELPAERTAMSSVSPDLAEVEVFFKDQIAQKQKSLASLDGSEDVLNSFNTQLKELEEQFTILERNLSLDPSNEQIVQSMIINYKLRIEVLEKLMKTIEQENYKRLNTQQDEINA